MNALTNNLYLALLAFLIRYRRTALGPLWLLIGPSLFIGLLGFLYAEIGASSADEFIPHMAIGLVLWTLVQGFVTGSPTVFQRARAQIMQGAQSLDDVIATDVISTVLAFFHQLPIIAVVFAIYAVPLGWIALESVAGFMILLANGIWITQVFGILGARYRDLAEIFQAVMRIAFLATPIIWMPGEGMQGGVMSAFLVFNPFYHFIEIVRAPLLGQSPEPISWYCAGAFTFVGFCMAWAMRKGYARFVPLWV